MRTDSEIQKDVKDELSWEPSVDSKDINVTVKDSFVTLSGKLDSYSKKIAAENTALRVVGVANVVNNIEVSLQKNSEKTDSEIERAVYNTLEWSSSIPEKEIKVKVKDGWVTLDGNVEWDFQKRAATNAVSDLTGVKGLTNAIKVAPKNPTRADVKDSITSALKRNFNHHGEGIIVSIINDKVILTGAVPSLAEKRSAEKAAWSAPGVTEVENKLEIIGVKSFA
jgi:osmotically-inducible protein OsmY